MCRNQTLDGLPKHFPKKIHKAPCKIWYTAKMTTINKGTTVDTITLNQENLLTWTFPFTMSLPTMALPPIESKIAPAIIIRFIMTTLMNEQQPCKCVRVYEDSTLSKSTDVTNLLVDELKISVETTGGDAS